MIYKKTYQIEGKIITKNEIINLVNSILLKLSNEKELELTIVVDFVDHSSLEDNKIDLFNHIYFEKKKLKQIEIKVYCNHFKDYVNIILNSFNSNIYLIINEEELYDLLCHIIEENLSLMDNQNKIYLLSSKGWGYPILNVLIIALELLLIFILNIILKIKISILMVSILIFLIPTLISMCVIKYIENKYPINQIDFGNSSINHLKNEKSVLLKIIGFIITNVLLPILLSLIIK